MPRQNREYIKKSVFQTGYLQVLGVFFCFRVFLVLYVCLFELMLTIPVNSNDHVGTLPPLYVPFIQNQDVMTSKTVLQI